MYLASVIIVLHEDNRNSIITVQLVSTKFAHVMTEGIYLMFKYIIQAVIQEVILVHRLMCTVLFCPGRPARRGEFCI